jgi:hypothetical protein
VIIFIHFPQIVWIDSLFIHTDWCFDKSTFIFEVGKNNFEIKFAYVTNDTAETNIKNHSSQYTSPRETVICGSDGMTGDSISSIVALLIFSISC